jgi:hypothetical protein
MTLWGRILLLQCLNPSHPLLVAVSSVKDLGFDQWDGDDEGDDA